MRRLGGEAPADGTSKLSVEVAKYGLVEAQRQAFSRRLRGCALQARRGKLRRQQGAMAAALIAFAPLEVKP